jgi:glycosyltransferase involved in cell wall biosynthesis
MIRVAALTSGRHTPSTRYRVRQHIAFLTAYGIAVREYLPWIDKDRGIPGWPTSIRQRAIAAILPVYAAWHFAKMAVLIPGMLDSYRNQVTWISRHLYPGYPSFEVFIKKPILLDVDDAVWLMPPWGKRALASLARRSEMVVAGNHFLADWLSRYSRNVRIVPTAVDAERYVPAQAGRKSEDKFVIGWSGSRSNLCNLESLGPVLSSFLGDRRDAHLLIMADRPPHFSGLLARRMTFLPWTQETEVNCLQQMDVGLMPLPDTEWNRGKCAFKMLQYMACGLPVIVSPVGMNREVLGLGELGMAAASRDDWMDALLLLYRELDRGHRMGRNGRNIVLRYFDRKIITPKIADIIRGLVST